MRAVYLPVRLVSQRTNMLRWTGTCNVTSTAMALAHALTPDNAVTPDGLFALMAACLTNEKLLRTTRDTASVNHVVEGRLRRGTVENFRHAEGFHRDREFLNLNGKYLRQLYNRLGREEPYPPAEGEGAADGAVAVRRGRARQERLVSYHVTDDELYRNVWYRLTANRGKGKDPIAVRDAYLESKATWDGEAKIEKLQLKEEYARVPIGVMRLNIYQDNLVEVARIVCGMARSLAPVTLALGERGRPYLRMGGIEYDLSPPKAPPELAQELLALRDHGKKYVTTPGVGKEQFFERVRSLVHRGRVAVYSGRFTHGGHIVVICGYAMEGDRFAGVVVADPWGKGSYEDPKKDGARDYTARDTDALVVYEAESFLRAYKWGNWIEFEPMHRNWRLQHGSAGFTSFGRQPVAVVAPIPTQSEPAPAR